MLGVKRNFSSAGASVARSRTFGRRTGIAPVPVWMVRSGPAQDQRRAARRAGARQAPVGVGRWITFYNHQRPHAADGGQPPAMVSCNSIETDQQVQAVA